MESPGTKAYTPSELRRMFASVTELRITPVVTAYDRRVAGPVVDVLGRRLGWFIVVEGMGVGAARLGEETEVEMVNSSVKRAVIPQ